MTAALKKVPAIYTPRTPAEAALLLLQIAASQIGYREGKSKSGEWNNDTMFGVWYGLNFASWCAMFVSWCSSIAGFEKIIPKHAYTPAGFNWFAARGLADGRTPPTNRAATGMGKPRVGDIMYVHGYVSGEWRIHHVGIVEKILPGGKISTVEGNTNLSGSAQGNGVYRLTRTVTSRLFFCHPQYAAVVAKAPAKPPAAKPTDPTTPPSEKDWFDMATPEQIQAAMTAALQAVLPAQTAAANAIEKQYFTGDNRYEAQAESYFVVAQAYASIRLPELLKDKSPRDAMDAARLEVVPFLSPLWAPPAKQ